MNGFDPEFLLERNPVTQKRHRQEVMWQISIPIIIGLLIVLALCVLSSLGSPDNVSRWADTSLILLIVPALFFSLLFLIILSALIFGIVKLIGALPVFAFRAQHFFVRVKLLVRTFCDKVVEPILRAQSFTASTRALRRNIRR
jgi:hypothetical protein